MFDYSKRKKKDGRKNEEKSWKKQKTNSKILVSNTNVSVVTLNISDLNILIKNQVIQMGK